MIIIDLVINLPAQYGQQEDRLSTSVQVGGRICVVANVRPMDSFQSIHWILSSTNV